MRPGGHRAPPDPLLPTAEPRFRGCPSRSLIQGCRTYGTISQNFTRKVFLGSLYLPQSQFLLFLLPDLRRYIVKNVCIYTHIWLVENVYELPLIPSNSASETFLHKSGAVRSVDWIFIGAWRWLGECETLGRTLYMSYTVIICFNDCNNAVINNNYGRLQDFTWYIIYLLTAIGLSPGGSTHLHANNT